MRQRQDAGGNAMDEVFKMYAMSDDNDNSEPAELDPDHDEALDDDEDEEVETSSVLTSSDDDEGVPEEATVVISQTPQTKPARKAAKKAPAKKAAKKAPAKK